MRALGSRIFLIPAYPVNGVPPAHPSWDRVWSAAVALGMTPMLHTGFEHMRFDPGWANLGGDATLLRMLGGAHRHVAPMTLLNALVYSGVFERFPTLTLLFAEVGTGWLPFLFREIDDRISPDRGALPRQVEAAAAAERVRGAERPRDPALRRQRLAAPEDHVASCPTT